MQTLAALSLIADVSCTTVVLLLTIPAIRTILESAIQRFHGADRYLCEFYVDQDGEADKASIIGADKKGLRIFIVVFAIGGNIIACVRLLVHDKMFAWNLWAQLLALTLILVQSIAIAIESLPTTRFSIAWKQALSYLATIASIGSETYARYKANNLNSGHLYLMGLEVGFAVFSISCDLSLPQRPDVFRNEKMVDRERTASLLSRMTFNWTALLIRLTSHKNDIHIDHLPELDSDTRAKNLQEGFVRAQAQVISDEGSSKPLWQILWRSYRRHLLYQFILSLPTSFLTFGPHVSLLRILQILERRSEGGRVTADLWFWVLMMGVSISLSSWLESCIGWIASNKIAIRVYEQLSAVLFSKSMNWNGLADTKRERINLQSEEQDEVTQGTQISVNLMAVDVPRVAGIATFLYNFLLVPLKLGVACILLQRVLGWRSLLAGLVALALLMLLNHVCMTKYTKAGKDLMICRDRKVITLTEALQGIRQIKFSATENQWGEHLKQLRTAELKAQATSFRWNVICFSVWVLAPILLSVASLSVYTIIHGGLTPSIAFTAISALTSMELALSILPELITNAMDAIISMKRIDQFLEAPEKIPTSIASTSICFDNATVAWSGSISGGSSPSETPFLLRNLNAKFPQHGLTLVCGRTGAGKSLLLATILGESEVISGQVKRPARGTSRCMYDASGRRQEWIIEPAIAYVAQVPWIEAATIRENILFGLPFDGQRYRNVLSACALVHDLQILDDGDLTELGPNGVNLSGGQKARISLARGLYSRAGILIMDDIFSAVDIHTAQHLYEHALTGELAAGRTRVLATHHVRLCLPRVDYLVNLDSGSMVFAGSVTEIRKFGALDSLLGRAAGVHEQPETTKNSESSKCLDLSTSCCKSSHNGVKYPSFKHRLKRPKQFVEEEGREKGAIALSVFHRYVQKCGGWLKWVMLALCFAIYTGLVLGKGWWLGLWSDQTISSSSSSGVSHELQYYLGIYVALSGIVWIVGSLRSYFALTASLQASESLFDQVLHNIFRAPLRWLDTVPIGRILNRFTADFNMIDSHLGFDITLVLGEGMQAICAVIAGILISPVIIVFSVIVAWVCSWYARQYLTTARELKRLESTSRSPVYELLGSSLSGLWTIRSYGRTSDYIARMHGLIDRHARAYWNLCLLNHWLNFRINQSGACFSTVAAVTFTLLQDLKASSAGFAISFIIQLSTALAMAIRMYVMFELDMNCVERVLEYSDIKTERYKGLDAPAGWPSEGSLEVANLSISYAPDHPPVLCEVTFQVSPGEKIGIVGRTGAGKSSLALALFRFLEAQEGQILIDGLDISQINLQDLRRRIGIIPQDPTLFAGTIRSNLDPFNEHDDREVLVALGRVQWTFGEGDASSAVSHEITAKELDSQAGEALLHEKTALSELDITVAEGGSNFSQGQRQLLCLARAMLSAPKILVLDEATSAVDAATDEVIQKSIRSDFGRGSSTMLVIAHRISTIADFDRVLVLDAGRVVEFASPWDLMQLEDGVFRRMVEEDGECERLRRLISKRASRTH